MSFDKKKQSFETANKRMRILRLQGTRSYHNALNEVH